MNYPAASGRGIVHGDGFFTAASSGVLNPSCAIKKIFKNTDNLKYLAILQLLYSSGLRISEATNLRLTDINSSTMRLHVELGKGAKERYTKLSKMALNTLRSYWKQYKPNHYLFPGQKKGTAIHTRSVAIAFKKALIKAGIKKPATLHTLRHSFASHLLDQDEKLPTIQKLLGHSSLKSTVIYLHVSETSLDKVVRPFQKIRFSKKNHFIKNIFA